MPVFAIRSCDSIARITALVALPPCEARKLIVFMAHDSLEKHNALHSGKMRARASFFSDAVTCYKNLYKYTPKPHMTETMIMDTKKFFADEMLFIS